MLLQARAWHARACTACMYTHVHPADPCTLETAAAAGRADGLGRRGGAERGALRGAGGLGGVLEVVEALEVLEQG